MQASRWVAVWMAAGAFGIAGTSAGCGDNTEGPGPAASSTTTTTGEGGSSSTGTGGSGGEGAGGEGGAGAGGSGGEGTGGEGGAGGEGGEGGEGGAGAGGEGGAGAGGSGGSMEPMFSFTLNGVNYRGATYASKTVHITLNGAGEDTAALDESAMISNDGTFTVTGQVLGGRPYTMWWYVDVNDNGACDPVPADRVWTEEIPTVTADVVRNVEPNTDFASCP